MDIKIFVNTDRLLWRLMKDESNFKFIEEAKWDKAPGAKCKGQYTNGWGTKALNPTEKVTSKIANERFLRYVKLCGFYFLTEFGEISSDLNDVRTEVLINMFYNLGHSGVLRFRNMVRNLKKQPINFNKVAFEMLDSSWAKNQVTKRAWRLATEMASGEYYYNTNEIDLNKIDLLGGMTI